VYTQVRSDHLADAVSEAGAKEQTRRKSLSGQRFTVAVRREDEVSLRTYVHYIAFVFYSCCIFFLSETSFVAHSNGTSMSILNGSKQVCEDAC